MEDYDDKVPSAGFEPLFIKEEEGDPDRRHAGGREGLSSTEAKLKQSALMKPYLQEMDELLKSCEELTGIPFGSHYSASYTETSLSQTSQSQGREKATIESYGETRMSPEAYLSTTTYMDTHMEGAGAEEQLLRGAILDRCGVTGEGCRQSEMPLTSAGTKLSESMEAYEGQLMGMLAMLENCMEESGMDFEPQDWTADPGQEYVHIDKNPPPYRGTTTLVPVQHERATEVESQPMQVESSASQMTGDEVSKDVGRRVTVSLAADERQRDLLPSYDNTGGFSVEGLQRTGQFKSITGDLCPEFKFTGPSVLLKGDTMYCEGIDVGAETKEDITEIEIDDNEQPEDNTHEPEMDTIDLGSGVNELAALGSHMEGCIEEVQQLQKRRKELLAEVLQLRGHGDQEELGEQEEEAQTEEQIDSKVAELMDALKMEKEGRREERKKEMKILKEERAEEERRMWKVHLERQALQDELRKLKRRLFAMARDCAQSQAALNARRREVELLKREEEKLNSVLVQLTEEGCQLRAAQQQQLSKLRAEIQVRTSNQSSNTQEELTECRRHSCGDIQQYLQGGLKALEDRYEPILLALLKRREATASVLVKAKDQAQELRAQLTPLREEMQKLTLQRACLEEKLKLVHLQRREDVGQYKETVYFLEESSRELKTELQIQKKKTKEIAELKDSLYKQLLLYRAMIEDHNKRDHEEKT